MPQAGGVAIFWNLDQCPLPDDRAASTVTKGIRRICQTYSEGIKEFTAYSSEALKTTSSSLLQCGVTVKYSPPHNIHKPLIVIQMTVDILMMITRGNTIGTFILIAGDRDYSYMLESIRDQGVGVVVMAPKGTACSSSCLLWPEAAITAGSLPELTGNNSPPGVISLPISAKSQFRHSKLEVLEPATGAMEQDVESGDHLQDASMDVDSDAEVKAAPFKRTEGHPVKSKIANKDGTSSVAGSDSESMEPIIVNAPGSQPSHFTERDNSDEDYLLSSGVEGQAKDETAVEHHRRTTSTSRSLGDDNEGSSEDEEGEPEQEDSGDEDEDEEEEEESSDDEDRTEDESAVESVNDDESSDASAEEDNGSVKYHRRTTSTSLGHDNGAEGDSQGSSGDDGDGSEQEDSDDDDEDGEESEEESSDDEDGTEDESAVESCNHESSDASEEDSDNESEEEDTDDSEDESEPDDTVTATSRKRKRKSQNRSPDRAQPNGSTNGKPPRKRRTSTGPPLQEGKD